MSSILRTKISGQQILDNTVTRSNLDTSIVQDIDTLKQHDGEHASDISQLQSDVSAEQAARVSGDSALGLRVDGVEGNLSSEVSRATAAESSLQSAITSEESARVAADTALGLRITALETYDKETVFVDSVNGVDSPGRGTLLQPFKTINYAYSQIPVVTGATDLEKVTKFVTEKIVFELAPGTYSENVQVGFKRARVAIVGNGARILGNVKCKVLKADFPVASLESFKAQMPAPYTGASAQMCFEIAGEAGGGLEGDATANIVTVTGLTSLDFENGGANYNWDSNYGQFYTYFDNVNLVGGFNMIHDNSVATARAPACVVEVESSKIGNGDIATRSYFGFVPFGSATTVPTYGGLTLKAHNSTIASVLGPTLTIGEIDGCRLYDIDRTMGGVVTNGSVSGSTSTSYIGIVNTQFRVFGTGTTAYKIGSSSANVSYKIDAASYGTLSTKTLDVAAGRTVSYTLLDVASGLSVTPSGNISSTTVQTALQELQGDIDTVNTSLATKANASALTQEISDRIAGDSALQTSITSVQSNLTQEIANRQAGDLATLDSAKAYADSKVADVVNSAPAVLDTLNELAAALGSDPQFATTVANNIGTVSTNLAAEVTRATGAEATLTSNLNAEITRAQGAEAALDTRVSNLENSAFVTREVPVGVIDGVNKVFTLANTPNAGTEQVFLNGVLQESGTGGDYTISGATITFGIAPQQPYTLFVSYITGNLVVASGSGGLGGGSGAGFTYSDSAVFSWPGNTSGNPTQQTYAHNNGTFPDKIEVLVETASGGWVSAPSVHAGGSSWYGYFVGDSSQNAVSVNFYGNLFNTSNTKIRCFWYN